MSYGITPYRVELNKIKALFGCRDAALQTGLLHKQACRLDELDELCDGMPTSREVLAEFFAGEVSEIEAGHLYWYIVEMLCQQCGVSMANDAWYPASDDDLYAMKSLSRGSTAMDQLPRPMDFPTVRVALNEDFDAVMAEAEEKISNEAMKHQFIGWVEQARQHHQDLVLFYY